MPNVLCSPVKSLLPLVNRLAAVQLAGAHDQRRWRPVSVLLAALLSLLTARGYLREIGLIAPVTQGGIQLFMLPNAAQCPFNTYYVLRDRLRLGRNKGAWMSPGEGRADLAVPPDADIVARIAAGDRIAEAEFVRKYERGVLVLVRRHCRPNDPVVQDLAQEVLARVLERLRAGAIRDAAALPAYVRTTIIYTTSAEYRTRRTTESTSVLDGLVSDDNPAERLSSHELSHLLKSLLAQLPVARDREILVRFYLDEQDKDDVCRQLGIDASHFHRVVFRARERFRQLLQQRGIEST